MAEPVAATSIPAFDRRFFASADLCTRIGAGSIGGKAQGLLGAQAVLAGLPPEALGGFEVRIPRMIVVTTAVFDEFMAQNGLDEVVAADPPDDRLAHAFHLASLPVEWLGDLRAIVEEVHSPLAVRSSSLLEDSFGATFSGIYRSIFLPNTGPLEQRLQDLLGAIAEIYTGVFSPDAMTYRRRHHLIDYDERMAVMIQPKIA